MMSPSDDSIFSRATVENKQPREKAVSRNSALVPDRGKPRYRDSFHTELFINSTRTVTAADFPIDIPLIIIFIIIEMDSS